jgi:hypothetical protein
MILRGVKIHTVQMISVNWCVRHERIQCLCFSKAPSTFTIPIRRSKTIGRLPRVPATQERALGFVLFTATREMCGTRWWGPLRGKKKSRGGRFTAAVSGIDICTFLHKIIHHFVFDTILLAHRVPRHRTVVPTHLSAPPPHFSITQPRSVTFRCMWFGLSDEQLKRTATINASKSHDKLML